MGIGGDSNGTPDYLLVGHAARDVFGTTSRLGGTVVYAGATAIRFGRRVGIVTAGDVALSDDVALAGARVASLSSRATTTYEITVGQNGRALRLLDCAPPLTWSMAPPTWQAAEIVHLAPIANEIPLDMAAAFPAATVVASLQGWLRSFSFDGSVSPAPQRAFDLPLELFTAAVVSADDLAGDVEVARRIASRVPVLALTRGSAGCRVYRGRHFVDIPAFPAQAVDTTGAGDVFAAAFFIRLVETDDATESARFACCAAALSVEGYGTAAIPTREAVAARLAR